MIKFNFKIDKETAFDYWIQSLVKWGWYFESKNYEYYKNLIGGFSKEEKEALEEVKNFLNKDNYKFLWLWDRYTNELIKNKEDKIKWDRFKEVFSYKFNKVWDKEIDNLEEWQKVLGNYNFNELEPYLNRISNFFGSEYPEEIDIKLLLSYSKEVPTGHAKKEIKNLILLKLSNLEINEIAVNRVIETIIHEVIHRIEYDSNLEELLKDSFVEYIVPTSIEINKKFKWKYLLKETVITSMSSQQSNSYIGEILSKKQAEDNKIINFNLKESLDRNNYGLIIKFISENLLQETKKYLENNRKLDQAYTNKVAQEWVDLFENNK